MKVLLSISRDVDTLYQYCYTEQSNQDDLQEECLCKSLLIFHNKKVPLDTRSSFDKWWRCGCILLSNTDDLHEAFFGRFLMLFHAMIVLSNTPPYHDTLNQFCRT